MNKDQILSKKVVELRAKLTELGLATTGRKAVLQDRLGEHFGVELEDETNNVDDVLLEEGDIVSVGNEGNEMVSVSGESHRCGVVEGARFTLRDIEESMNKFGGNNQPPVEEWLVDFEQNALAVGWNSIQKFIYAKQLMEGAAKAFVRSQRSICSWEVLKVALSTEFGERLPQIEVHRRLESRRKKANEDHREYLYCLMEIARPAEVDEASIVEYFIEGLPDTKDNKKNLYQARTVAELKEQLMVYEKSRAGHHRTARTNIVSKPEAQGGEQVIRKSRCYKCGSEGHLAKSCVSKGFKCFRCGEEGHLKVNCQQASLIKREKAQVNTLDIECQQDEAVKSGSLIFKEVIVNNVKIPALVDTGCVISLIRADVLPYMLNPRLKKESRRLVGIGAGGISTIGSFRTAVFVDDTSFPVRFHVVHQDHMEYKAVLGSDVLEENELVVSQHKVRFVNKQYGQKVGEDAGGFNASEPVKGEKSNERWEEFEMMCVEELVGEKVEHEVELSHLTKQVAEIVGDIVRNYKPLSGSVSPVEMKILLSDEVPVYERPRRMCEADNKCETNS